MGLSLFAAADGEPISLDEAKAHLRVDIDDEDDLIVSCIAAARSHLEGITGRSFVSQTWDYTIDNEWPWALNLDTRCNEQMIELPRAPLVSVTSITYVDTAGASQTLASNQYVVDGAGTIGRIYPAYDVSWPSVRSQKRAITVRFVAGYGTAVSVPEALKQALLLLIAHFYTQRETVVVGQVTAVPMAVDSLVAPYRVYW
jgi:uncharacterized phiE125 gp8 family phage protein